MQQYMGRCVLAYLFLLWLLWEYMCVILLLSSNRKYEPFFCHCLGLGRETIVCAIYLVFDDILFHPINVCILYLKRMGLFRDH